MYHKKNRRNPEKTRTTRLTAKQTGELMAFLLEELKGKSRSAVKSHLQHRQVSVAGQVVTAHNFILHPGDHVEIFHGLVPQENRYRGLQIVYEDKDIVVINKNSGLLSISTDGSNELTAYSIVKEHVKISDPRNKIFVVHRLDKETSGIMMFVKSEKIKMYVQQRWSDIVVQRNYIVLVEGVVKVDDGTITSWLKENSVHHMFSSQIPNDGDLAITRFRVIGRGDKYSLLEATLETGRKNQIRVHMADIGHPVAGDRKYGAKTNPLGRLGLHAKVMVITHPSSGDEQRFEAATPKSFTTLVKI